MIERIGLESLSEILSYLEAYAHQNVILLSDLARLGTAPGGGGPASGRMPGAGTVELGDYGTVVSGAVQCLQLHGWDRWHNRGADAQRRRLCVPLSV